MGWEESSSRARRLHRPSLRDWERDGLARSFVAYAEGVLGVDHRPYSCFTAGTGARTDKGGGTEAEEWSIGREEAVRMGREDLRRRRREGAGGGGTGTGGATTTTTTMCPVVLDASDLSPRDFKELYESSGVPVVIRGIPHGEIFAGRDGGGPMADDEEKKDDDEKRECRERLVARDADDGRGLRRRQDGDPGSASSPNNTTTTTSAPGRRGRAWPAVRNWSIPSLLADPVLSDVRFKCGEDDDGRSVRMRLRHFLRYLERNRDDSPLYVFDATFDECRRSRRLLDDYDVPEYFDEDLLGLVGETRRPPYRWFLVGPERSGTTVHVDPLGTSAWNTVVHGVKRWALFPPRTSREAARGRGLVLRGEDDEAVHYFTVILPRIKRKAAAVAAATAALGGGDDGGGGGGGGGGGRRGDPYADLECYEFTQYPGETVYVPRGWWHAVLNVTHTVGVTQNYCSRRNFDDVWRATRGGRKKMACTWLRKLGEAHPDLARRARDLNDVDGHVMWEDDPEEQRRWRRKREERERRRKERGERGKRGEGAAVEEEDDEDEDRRKKSSKSKREKWGEHRTAERRGSG